MSNPENNPWKRKPHKHVGSIDKDCKKCGYSIYVEWHTDGFSETEVGKVINGRKF